MRTAEEMIRELFDSALLFTDVEILMKRYAKEAIVECAKRAKWKAVPPRMTNMDGVEVDKRSILSLINELK